MICYSNKDFINQSTEFESKNAYENMRGKKPRWKSNAILMNFILCKCVQVILVHTFFEYISRIEF